MFRITLNRVHDTVRINEGAEHIDLRVDGDAMRIMAGLNQAQKMLNELNEQSGEEAMRDAALFFAGAIFGQNQAQALLCFYNGDPACVVNVCGRYFSGRLARLIEKAQKNAATTNGGRFRAGAK